MHNRASVRLCKLVRVARKVYVVRCARRVYLKNIPKLVLSPSCLDTHTYANLCFQNTLKYSSGGKLLQLE